MKQVTISLIIAAAALAACRGSFTDSGADDVGVERDMRAADDGGGDPDAGGEDVDASTTNDAGADVAASDTGIDMTDMAPATQPYLYVAETDGTITVFDVEEATGDLTLNDEVNQPGGMRFLAFAPDLTRVYAASDDRVQAFEIGSGQPIPSYLGDASSVGRGTHLEVDHTGDWIFVASYGDDLVAKLPVGTNGVPEDATTVLGGGDDPDFCQNAHQVRVHPSNGVVYAPCLGSDHIAVMNFDASTGELVPQSPAPVQSGAGPRHMDFHPTMDRAYVLNESDSTVNVFSIDTSTGALTELQSITTIPAGESGPSASSDIHVSPDGAFVYAVNREPLNNIAIFDVGADGTLSVLDHASTGGDHSRSFTVDRTMNYLYLGHADSMDLMTFDVESDGRLTQRGTETGFEARIFYTGLSYLPLPGR